MCGDLPVAAVEIGGDRGPLGTEAQPGFALAAVTDPVVADEFSAVCGHGRTGCPGGRGLALDGGHARPRRPCPRRRRTRSERLSDDPVVEVTVQERVRDGSEVGGAELADLAIGRAAAGATPAGRRVEPAVPLSVRRLWIPRQSVRFGCWPLARPWSSCRSRSLPLQSSATSGDDHAHSHVSRRKPLGTLRSARRSRSPLVN